MNSNTPEAAALDDPLFPPRLDRLPVPETADGLGLGAGPEYGQMVESICGTTDDSQAVEQYSGTLGVPVGFVAAHQKPVAQVQWNSDLASRYTNPGDVNGVRWGTGTMIGPDLFLTCGHLFDQAPNGWTVPRQNGTANAITPQQIALEMHLNFLYQLDPSGTLRAEQSFPVTALLEYRLGGIDMALCRIGGSPGSVFGWTEVSATNPVVGEMIAIIGHPAGMPKRIEAGPASAVSGGTIRYADIDTLGGNSGSGILQASTGRIVGIHTNGGCNPTGGSNLGQAIAAVRAVSPILQALPASSRTARADDGVATAIAADVAGTTLARDVGGVATATSRDVFGTTLSRDLGTLKASDTGLRDILGTSLARDVGPATRFGRDVGGPPFDPDLTRVEGVVDPGRIPVDWGRRLRPFVQAGRYAPQEEVEAEPDVLEAVLVDLDEQIELQTAALERLHELREMLSEL